MSTELKIGIEFEGVFVKNGVPIRAARLFDRDIPFKDTYDVCAEPCPANSVTYAREYARHFREQEERRQDKRRHPSHKIKD